MTDTDTRTKMGRPTLETEPQAVQIAVRLTPTAVAVLDAAPGENRSTKLRRILEWYSATRMATPVRHSPH